MPSNQKHSFGIYIHWPYCLKKCPYCDFFSNASQRLSDEILFQAYKRDLRFFIQNFQLPKQVDSIFFGGGTPSLMTPYLLEKILKEITTHFRLSSTCEISLEANPDAIDKEKMMILSSLGVNRLSIGVQALNQQDLSFLGRTHTLERALDTIKQAQEIFSRLNIDLIYARPNQTLKDWEKELSFALDLKLTHYSLYQLTIEEGTLFYKKGVQEASSLLANRLYRLTEEMMNNASIPSYEVSNYALKGQECRHNLLYWQGGNYLGIGPASHGRIDLTASMCQSSIKNWLLSEPEIQTLTQQEKKEELILMGLRLTQEGFPINELSKEGVKQALQKKWATQKNGLLYPTLRGRLMLNRLIELMID